MDISREIIAIIAAYKNLDPATIQPESTFEELGIDSLDAIDIVYEIEEKYGVQVPQDALDLSTSQTVSDVMAVIDKVRSANGQAGAAPAEA